MSFAGIDCLLCATNPPCCKEFDVCPAWLQPGSGGRVVRCVPCLVFFLCVASRSRKEALHDVNELSETWRRNSLVGGYGM